VRDTEASRWFASIVGYDHLKAFPLDDHALGEWCATMEAIFIVYHRDFVAGIRRRNRIGWGRAT